MDSQESGNLYTTSSQDIFSTAEAQPDFIV